MVKSIRRTMSTLKKNLENKINSTINTWKQLKEGMKDRKKAFEISVFITDMGLLANLLNKDYVSEQSVGFIEDMYGQVYLSFNKKFTQKTDEDKAVDNNKETGFIKYGDGDETSDHIKGITNKMLEEYLEKKKGLAEQISFKNNKDYDESCVKEDIKEYLKDLVGNDVEVTDKMVEEFICAQNKLDERRSFKKNTKGQIVKRVPPASAGVDEILGTIGLDDLAKEFSVKRAKPLFADFKKDGPVTKMLHHETPSRFVEDDQALSSELLGSAFESLQKQLRNLDDNSLNKLMNEISCDDGTISKEVIDSVIKDLEKNKTNKESCKKKVLWLSTVVKLEKLIGKLTTDELNLKRRLTMAKKALDLAMEKIYSTDTEEIINGAVYNDEENLKKEFENLFSHKKLY